MKIKAFIYFLLMCLGVFCIVWGQNWMEQELAQSIGFVLLILGVYLTSRSYSGNDGHNPGPNE